jgi:hypothetical protein
MLAGISRIIKWTLMMNISHPGLHPAFLEEDHVVDGTMDL